MLSTSKNVNVKCQCLFQGHNHLLTIDTDDPSLAGARAIIKVHGHQHQWLAGGYDLEIGHFWEVDSMVVTWWGVSAHWSWNSIFPYRWTPKVWIRLKQFQLSDNNLLTLGHMHPTYKLSYAFFSPLWQSLPSVLFICTKYEHACQ